MTKVVKNLSEMTIEQKTEMFLHEIGLSEKAIVKSYKRNYKAYAISYETLKQASEKLIKDTLRAEKIKKATFDNKIAMLNSAKNANEAIDLLQFDSFAKLEKAKKHLAKKEAVVDSNGKVKVDETAVAENKEIAKKEAEANKSEIEKLASFDAICKDIIDLKLDVIEVYKAIKNKVEK